MLGFKHTDAGAELGFDDIFASAELQRIQDSLAMAMGVASRITSLDGQDLTTPSNVSRFCREYCNCRMEMDAICLRARNSSDDATTLNVWTCQGAGLWEACVGVSVSGVRVANWLIGQVRVALTKPEAGTAIAQETNAEVHKALLELPELTRERFEAIVQAHVVAIEVLAEKGYQAAMLRLETRERRLRDEIRQTLMNKSRDGIVIIDHTHAVIEANDRFAAMLGYSPEEVLTLKTWDYDARMSEGDIKRNFPALGSVNMLFETQHRRKDGSLFDVEVSISGEMIGERQCVICICRDITEKKRIEQWQRILLQMVEQSPVSIVMTDTDGNIEYVNPKLSEVSGYTFEEVRGKNPEMFASGLDNPRESQEMWRIVSSGGLWSGEFRNRHKNGSIYIEKALIAPIRDSEGVITHFVAIKKDVTQSRRAEEELLKKDIDFRKFLDLLPQRVAFIDRDLNYQFVNKAYAAILPDMAGVRNVRDLLAAKDFAQMQLVFAEVIQGKTIHFLRYLEYWDGSVRYVDGNLIPEISLDGEVLGFYAVLNDLTELKKIEERLRLAKDAAEAANRLKSEFLANMSHEVRTPLNGILGVLQILQTTPLDEEQQEYVQLAVTSSQRLTRLLSDILDISKIEADKLLIQEQSFNPRNLGRSLTDLFRSGLLEKKLEFQFQCATDIPRCVVGDEARMLQILFNLVGNALKFTDSGYVRVGIFRLPFAASGQIRLLACVEDSGSGISEEAMDRIFEPFMQLDSSYTKRHQGVGLGLTIVSKLVVRMGGSVCLESSPGQGTTFYVSLPFGCAEDEPTGYCAGRPSGIASAGLCVLLVEDDDINLRCAHTILEKLGHQVVPAINGREAFELYAKQQFDLILVDIQMPVMDGLALTKAIREREAGKEHVPIIALTAHVMSGDREKFLSADIDGYVSKPFEIDVMEREIRLVLGT